jgi:hypothetical protein
MDLDAMVKIALLPDGKKTVGLSRILAASTYRFPPKPLPPEPPHGKHRPFREDRYIWIVWRREDSIWKYLDGEEDGRDQAFCSSCHRSEKEIFGIFPTYVEAIKATRDWRKGKWYNIAKFYDSNCY